MEVIEPGRPHNRLSTVILSPRWNSGQERHCSKCAFLDATATTTPAAAPSSLSRIQVSHDESATREVQNGSFRRAALEDFVIAGNGFNGCQLPKSYRQHFVTPADAGVCNED